MTTRGAVAKLRGETSVNTCTRAVSSWASGELLSCSIAGRLPVNGTSTVAPCASEVPYHPFCCASSARNRSIPKHGSPTNLDGSLAGWDDHPRWNVHRAIRLVSERRGWGGWNLPDCLRMPWPASRCARGRGSFCRTAAIARIVDPTGDVLVNGDSAAHRDSGSCRIPYECVDRRLTVQCQKQDRRVRVGVYITDHVGPDGHRLQKSKVRVVDWTETSILLYESIAPPQ